jgi:alkyl sulfatase BDS1-like metallo-beta-lactamase superfamily hydrolase
VRVSEHFRTERLAEGIFAAIATKSGGVYSNAGIIDRGNRTLIFDAFDTVQAGEDLRIMAEELTSSPIAYVSISHSHSNHWSGVQAFPSQTSVISTHITRDLLFEEIKELTALKANPSELV